MHNWLAITDDPAFTLRGKAFDLRQAGDRFPTPYCHVASVDSWGIVSCGYPKGRLFELVPRGKSFALRSGPDMFCADWPEGIMCSSRFTGEEPGIDIITAGGGRVRLRGRRGGDFCADSGRGLICDVRDEHRAALFTLQSNSTPPVVPVLAHDRNAAATFIVHRESLDSPMIALLCKGRGLYLAEDHTGQLSCSSKSPWFMASARAAFRNIPGLPKWDLGSVKLQATVSGNFLAPSGPWQQDLRAVLLDANDEFKWKTILVGGCETHRPLIRGVNLGGWFLLEKWMTSYLFSDKDEQPFEDTCDAQDEYGLMSLLGEQVGRKRMEEHWSTWITEDDIRWMADHGINAVRVPFGYWMVFPMSPFVPGQLKYLEQLFTWCEKYSVSILLDFHGLKGSQTGTPTSGNCGGCGNETCGKTWLTFLDEQKINLEVIRRLVVRFSSSPAYLGFAVANEVSSRVDEDALMSFYQKAYDIIREQDEDALVVLYGTFAPSLYPWQNFKRASLDFHIYFAWRFGRPTLDQQVNLIRARNAVSAIHWPVLVGEWSLAANGHPDTLQWDPHRRDSFFDSFARMQLQAWEMHSIGWFYWSYKTRFRNSTWNYRDMCEVGWLPGCKPHLQFAPAEWWTTRTCAYAYLDGQCDPETGLPLMEPTTDAELEGERRWAIPVLFTAVLVAGIMVFAALVAMHRHKGPPHLLCPRGVLPNIKFPIVEHDRSPAHSRRAGSALFSYIDTVLLPPMMLDHALLIMEDVEGKPLVFESRSEVPQC